MSSQKFKFAESRTVVIVGFIGAVCTVIASLTFLPNPWRWIAASLITVVVVVGLVYEAGCSRLSLLQSGIVQYRKAFQPEDNAEVFPLIKRSYAYLGHSYGTASENFCTWYDDNTERPSNVEVRILIAHPEAADALRYEAHYLEDIPYSSTEEASRVAASQQKILSTLDKLLALKAAETFIQIRFHRERLHEWMHLVDDELAYVGILPRHRSGRVCPVMILKNTSGGVFGSYRDRFESLWDACKNSAESPREVLNRLRRTVPQS